MEAPLSSQVGLESVYYTSVVTRNFSLGRLAPLLELPVKPNAFFFDLAAYVACAGSAGERVELAIAAET